MMFRDMFIAIIAEACGTGRVHCEKKVSTTSATFGNTSSKIMTGHDPTELHNTGTLNSLKYFEITWIDLKWLELAGSDLIEMTWNDWGRACVSIVKYRDRPWWARQAHKLDRFQALQASQKSESKPVRSSSTWHLQHVAEGKMRHSA